MSKELEEIREKYKDDNGLIRRLDIIEKELNRLKKQDEFFDWIRGSVYYKPYGELELIKEEIDCRARKFIIENCFPKELKALDAIKHSIIATPNIPIIKTPKGDFIEVSLALTQEEYDLLKEVLL